MKRLLYVIAALVGAGSPAAAMAGSAGDCHVGAYRLSDGSVVDVGATDGPELRWRRLDGTTGALHEAAGAWTSTLGWTDKGDGKAIAFSACAAGELTFDAQ